MSKYYPFSKKQRAALPLEFCHFEKVLVTAKSDLQQQQALAKKLRMISFYKKIAFYTCIYMFLSL